MLEFVAGQPLVSFDALIELRQSLAAVQSRAKVGINEELRERIDETTTDIHNCNSSTSRWPNRVLPSAPKNELESGSAVSFIKVTGIDRDLGLRTICPNAT